MYILYRFWQRYTGDHNLFTHLCTASVDEIPKDCVCYREILCSVFWPWGGTPLSFHVPAWVGLWLCLSWSANVVMVCSVQGSQIVRIIRERIFPYLCLPSFLLIISSVSLHLGTFLSGGSLLASYDFMRSTG